MKKNTVVHVIESSLVDIAKSVDTSRLSDMVLVVHYVRGGASTGTMTVYGSLDPAGTVKYALGIMPILTGTRDADGAIAYTTSTDVAYQIPGVHPYIFIDWNEGTDGATFSADIIGEEDL